MTEVITVAKVIANLENTIKGKELLLQEYEQQHADTFEIRPKSNPVIAFLKINIDELKRILTDLKAAV